MILKKKFLVGALLLISLFGVGCGDKKSRSPDVQPITRAELIFSVVKWSGGDLKGAAPLGNCYDDTGNHEFEHAVCFAKSRGWLKRYSNTDFIPDEIVSIEELRKLASAIELAENKDRSDEMERLLNSFHYSPKEFDYAISYNSVMALRNIFSLEEIKESYYDPKGVQYVLKNNLVPQGAFKAFKYDLSIRKLDDIFSNKPSTEYIEGSPSVGRSEGVKTIIHKYYPDYIPSKTSHTAIYWHDQYYYGTYVDVAKDIGFIDQDETEEDFHAWLKGHELAEWIYFAETNKKK
jgi:hypothetical protein